MTGSGGGPGERVLIAGAFTPGQLAAIRGRISRYAATAGLAEESREDFVAAVNEALTNLVRHGGGSGTLRLWHARPTEAPSEEPSATFSAGPSGEAGGEPTFGAAPSGEAGEGHGAALGETPSGEVGGGAVATAPELICEVCDSGPGFDAGDYTDRTARPAATTAGGLGLWLVRQLSTRCEIHSGPEGTRVRIVAPLPH
ncbi:ATP-binding protein [Rhizomonospora bruguierae]|uniref:ATP-binding protein n=1 Tax=Rhizomonospora bruguierae TaxID=1581705 RepID=UPI001BCFA22C|nr:ATP-binding protein [Micromonospora sp. NBRC 107566]